MPGLRPSTAEGPKPPSSNLPKTIEANEMMTKPEKIQSYAFGAIDPGRTRCRSQVSSPPIRRQPSTGLGLSQDCLSELETIVRAANDLDDDDH
jgi:hypothetical protein